LKIQDITAPVVGFKRIEHSQNIKKSTLQLEIRRFALWISNIKKLKGFCRLLELTLALGQLLMTGRIEKASFQNIKNDIYYATHLH
jgi:hypothetical protein